MRTTRIKQPEAKIYMKGKIRPFVVVFSNFEKLKEFQNEIVSCEKVVCGPIMLNTSEVRFIIFP